MEFYPVPGIQMVRQILYRKIKFKKYLEGETTKTSVIYDNEVFINDIGMKSIHLIGEGKKLFTEVHRVSKSHAFIPVYPKHYQE